jgi:hypothetical protein
MATVVCQMWLERERGWGQRPDGYSLHLSETDRKTYLKEYWDKMPKQVPDEYSKEDGQAFLLDLDENSEFYIDLMNSKNGIRCLGVPNGRS